MDPRLQPVIDEAASQRARFEGFCRSLTAAELARPVPGDPWCVGDYICHLATVDDFVTAWFGALANGEPWRPRAGGGGPFDIDDWNESRVGEARALPLEALLRAAAGRRRQLFDVFWRLPQATLDRTFDFRGKTITFLRYLELWTQHDPAHATDMLRALPERAEDPDVQVWPGRLQFPRRASE